MALLLAGTLGACHRPMTISAPPPTLRSASSDVNVNTHAHGALPSLEEAAQEARPIRFLGSYRRSIQTSSAEARTFFDQGLRLYWAFNHDEAYRSFAKAADLDPRCTMCFWGASLSLGPNYNMPMMPDRAQIAWEALEKAKKLAPSSPPVERALVGALASRYGGPRPVDAATQAKRNRAYADAMRQVARQYPQDDDAQALFAEAAMVLDPWKLWSTDGTPAPGTQEIVRTLEGALAHSPQHPGANHLYVHAVEASKEPGRALASAERLEQLMPNAGHMVHMPSHIYERVGRYEEAAEANRRAAAADLRYVEAIAPRRPPAVYEMYMAHNHQFLAYADSMQGRSIEAIEAARRGARLSPATLDAMPMLEMMLALPNMMMVRFGRWVEILAASPPDPRRPTARGLFHHSRGMAFVAMDHLRDAEGELAALRAIAKELAPDHPAMLNKASDVLAIASLVLEGKLAEHRGDLRTAVERLEDAARRESALAYNEPPDWWYSVRHVLGATLLTAGRARDAERVYREDLAVHPDNGWSLDGLALALERQGKGKEGALLHDKARAAWRHADVPLSGSGLPR